MKRGFGLATVIVALALLQSAPVPAATPNDFVGGNNGNDWNTAANWSLGHVPLATEDVTIASASPNLTSGANGVANSISVSSGRTLTITGKTLTVGTGTSSLAGSVAISNGTLTLNGDTTWSGGAASIQMDTSSTLTVNSTFEITANVSTNSDTGSVIHVSATGSVTTSNAGTANIGVTFDNDGSVSVGSGTLELAGDNATTTGSYSIASGAILLLNSGSLKSPASNTPMSISGSGTMKVASGTLTVGSGDTFTPHTVDLNGNSPRLTVNEDASVSTLDTNGGGTATRDGTGTLTVTGAVSFASNQTTFAGGTTTIADTVSSVALGSAGITVDGTQSATANATLTLNAPTTWSGGTNTINLIGGVTPATLNIGSTFDITGDGQIGSSFSTLVHVTSTGSITSSNAGTANIEPPLDNDGTVNVNSGTLELGSGDNATTTGSYAIANGATLLLNTGSLESPASNTPMSITGNGTTDVAGGTLTVGSGDTFTPHTVLLNGNGPTLTVNKDASITTLDSGGASTVTRNGTGTLTVTGAVNLAASNTTFGGGDTTIANTVSSVALGGAPITVDSSAQAAALTLDAPTTWSGGTNTITLFGGATPATLNIDASFDVTGDGVLNAAFSSLISVSGSGSITTSNPGTAQIVAPIDNAGSISVGSGKLDASGGLTQSAGLTSVAAGAELDGPVTLNGGTLKGGGTLGGPVDNAGGTVAPGASPGTLSITGDFTQDAGGTLQEEVDGTTAGTQFDVLQVSGNATLGGTVAIVQGGGFAASDGDSFAFMPVTGTITGTFASLTGSAIPSGGAYSLDYQTHAARLVVGVPLPSNQVKPSISGSPAAGQTLTCDNGSWSDVASFAYVWQRDGVTLAGATSQQYTVTTDDQGHSLTCQVTGTNSKGSTQATSDPVTVPQPAPTGGGGTPPAKPANTVAPSVPGTAKTGDQVTCSPGSWSGSPSFGFQWLRGSSPISGATGAAYTVTAADAGHALVCQVTATNASGSAQATSNQLVVQLPNPPPAPPTTCGSGAVGGQSVCLQGDTDLQLFGCVRIGNFQHRFPVALKKTVKGTKVNRLSRVVVVIFTLDGKPIGKDSKRPFFAVVNGLTLSEGTHALHADVRLQVPNSKKKFRKQFSFTFKTCA